MAKQISSLWVGLTGNVSGLAKSFGSAIAPVKGLSSHISALNTRLSSTIATGLKFSAVAAGVAAAGAAAGLVALTKSSITNIDKLKDQAESLGVSTDALSRMQYAASFAGVENEALATSFGKMLVNVSNAASGSKTAAAAFDRLGLNAKTLASLSPEVAFAKIADAIAAIENPYQRADAAQEIFGKSGKALIPVLNLGAEGLTQFYTEADRLNITIRQTDATKVEGAADAMGRIGKATEGVGNALAIKLAPAIELAGAKLIAFATSGEGVSSKVSVAFEWVTSAIAKSADVLELVKAGFYTLKGVATVTLASMLKPLTLVIEGLEWLGKKLGIVSDSSTWGAFASAFQTDIEGAASEAFKKAGESFDNFQNKVASTKATAAFADLRKQMEQLESARPPKPPTFRPIEPVGDPEANKAFGNLFGKVNEIGGRLRGAFGTATDYLADAFHNAIPDRKEIEIKPRLATAIRAGSAESIALRFGNMAATPSRGMNAAGNDVQKKQLTVQQQMAANIAKLASQATTAITEAFL